jgi:hypothetical protein
MTSGSTDTNEPVMTVENSACDPPPADAADWINFDLVSNDLT